ncbi:MAG: alpha/beta hydrolase [Desulfobacterales bacterium]|nr:alpha/beta hydrolase [Desulfobacterales bacterium]
MIWKEKTYTVCILFLVCFALSFGCSTKHIEKSEQIEIQNHVILMHKDGESMPLIPHTNNDKFSHIFNGLDDFLKSGQNNLEKNIIVYFHGGLNSYDGALKRVVDNIAKIKKENKTNQVYPIFINWRSGPFTTLGDHYFRIRNGEKSASTAKWTSPFYILSDVTRTIGNIPIAWYTEGRQLYENTVLNDYDKLLESDTQKAIVSMTEDNKESINALRRSQWVITSPFKVISAPFLFTYGSPAWDNMKRRTHTMFAAQDTDFNGPHPPPLGQINRPHPHPSGEALIFLRRLNQYIEAKRKNDPKLEFTLMGHSMGGIIINRALQDLPDIKVDNIVYMASADSLQNFLDATLPMVKKADRSPQIFNLHLHPENEDREVSAKGFAPSGSLLVWIDHTFGRPEYVLQRTSGRWVNVRRIIDFIPDEYRNRYHFKIFGRIGTCNDELDEASCKAKWGPQTHGAFDDSIFNFWKKEYWVGSTVN